MSSNHEKRGRKPRDTIPLMSQTAFVSPEPHARISCTKFNTQVILFPSNMTVTYSVQIYTCVVGLCSEKYSIMQVRSGLHAKKDNGGLPSFLEPVLPLGKQQ